MPRSASLASSGRGRYGSRSRSRSRTPDSRGSATPDSRKSRSRSRTPDSVRSRSASPSLGNAQGPSEWDEAEVEYDDFVAADEETPTFKLRDSTVNLIRSKVYQAPPLGKKYFNEMKKDRYMLARETHENLEPKPVPAQVVSSKGGMDLSRLHGSMYTLHGISRVAHRPVWALMEELQKTRGNLKKLPPASFVSPPFLSGNNLPVPAGHVALDYPEEERLRHLAKAPQHPSPQDFTDTYESLGVYKKYHELASKAMVSMLATIQTQQEAGGKVKESLDAMWSRTHDFINMARYQETHLKEMRRSQLIKAHTREFTEWLEGVYLKDREKLGARDQSDEILAADYDQVLKQFNEDRKNKNTALKSSHYARRNGGPGASSGANKRDGGQSSRDNDRARPPRNDVPRRGDDSRQPSHRQQQKDQRARKRGAGPSKDSGSDWRQKEENRSRQSSLSLLSPDVAFEEMDGVSTATLSFINLEKNSTRRKAAVQFPAGAPCLHSSSKLHRVKCCPA